MTRLVGLLVVLGVMLGVSSAVYADCPNVNVKFQCKWEFDDQKNDFTKTYTNTFGTCYTGLHWDPSKDCDVCGGQKKVRDWVNSKCDNVKVCKKRVRSVWINGKESDENCVTGHTACMNVTVSDNFYSWIAKNIFGKKDHKGCP